MSQQYRKLEYRPADATTRPVALDPPDDPADGGLSRRMFLEASGFSLFLAAMAGCTRAPTTFAPGQAEQPEGAVAGLARYYASVCGGCPAGCGTLVKTRDGRPIKLEGNPDHPLSRGGLCAVGQAAVLGLYDSQRLSGPLLDGRAATWEAADRRVQEALAEVQKRSLAVRLLTGTVTSPTTRAWIERFCARSADARHVVYDPLSSSAIAAAYRQTHGAAVLPRFRLDQADVIVSFDADFLGPWISPVEHTIGYQAGRAPRGKPAHMSYHVQIESRMSLTGSNADRRIVLLPTETALLAGHLAVRTAQRAGKPLAQSALEAPPVPAELVDELADRLWQARGKSLVLCGSQDVSLQVVCNLLNQLLENEGRTLDLDRPSYQRQGNDGQLEMLGEELAAKKVGLLLVAGVNPAYDLPSGWTELLRQSPHVVRLATHLDETAELAEIVCPESHALEAWGDAEPVAGVAGVMQPTIRPLGSTRSLLECLAAWSGGQPDGLALVREHWQKQIHAGSIARQPFQAFWDQALRDGYVNLKSEPPKRGPIQTDAPPLATSAAQPAQGQLTLVLHAQVGMLDGRQAHNPWLHELPDPVTKLTWDNCACLSPAAAERLGLKQGDVVSIEAGASQRLELPVLVQPGQHDAVVAVALGYGRKGTERFARVGPQWIEARLSVGPNGLVGVNAAPLLRLHSGALRYDRAGVDVRPVVGRKQSLACTQQHHEIRVPAHLAMPGIERRHVVQETTLAAYRQNAEAGNHATHEPPLPLWSDDHPYDAERWGLVIDLGKCTGCSACVIACQAENNVPVVGKDEVLRSREMHWIRIDRYYDPQPGGVDVLHQPMLCQHCGNAPCETVCPVLATVHSEDGLNQQAYNRCVGTRYCANNCPYKVRRFNWFAYAREDRLQNAVLNPDITVRSRGVMEKCSFCVQRIHAARQDAKHSGKPLADGAIRPACQQSCPAQALVFGNLNDPQSAAARAAADPRAYRVLEELNVRPVVSYLRVVRHREADRGDRHHG